MVSGSHRSVNQTRVLLFHASIRCALAGNALRDFLLRIIQDRLDTNDPSTKPLPLCSFTLFPFLLFVLSSLQEACRVLHTLRSVPAGDRWIGNTARLLRST